MKLDKISFFSSLPVREALLASTRKPIPFDQPRRSAAATEIFLSYESFLYVINKNEKPLL